MHDGALYRRAAIISALVAALAAIASSSAVHEALLEALRLAEEIIDRNWFAGAVIFSLLAAGSAMIAFVSIAVAVPAAVFAWGASITIGLLWLGWILGGIATYCIGKFLGRPVVRWLAADDALRKVEVLVPKNAPLSLIVLLQLALPSELPGYALGLVRYPFARYLTALAIAELPYALATVYLGESFIKGRSGLILGIGILITVFSLGALKILLRVLRERAGDDEARNAEVVSASAS